MVPYPLMYSLITRAQNSVTYAEFISLRFGNILIPEIKSEEPLAKECSHFIDCILDEKPILSDGIDGLRMVQVLEAGQESLKNNSVPVNLAI